MGNSNAKAQAAYRERQLRAGARRLNLFISACAAHALRTVAARDGVGQREVIERLALRGVGGVGNKAEEDHEDGKT